MSDVAHEAYRPAIEDGRGIFPEDFRLKAPRGFNDAVRAAATATAHDARGIREACAAS